MVPVRNHFPFCPNFGVLCLHAGHVHVYRHLCHDHVHDSCNSTFLQRRTCYNRAYNTAYLVAHRKGSGEMDSCGHAYLEWSNRISFIYDRYDSYFVFYIDVCTWQNFLSADIDDQYIYTTNVHYSGAGSMVHMVPLEIYVRKTL